MREKTGLRRLAATTPSNGPAAELLVSATNPDGWPLDELIAQARREFGRQLLALDGRDEKVRQKLVGYQGVIAALWEAEGRYRTLGPHQN
jgi:hypothetical protein